MEFAVLSTGIDLGGQVCKQVGVKHASGKGRGQRLWIDARKACTQSLRHHFQRKLTGIASPERKQGLDTAIGK